MASEWVQTTTSEPSLQRACSLNSPTMIMRLTQPSKFSGDALVQIKQAPRYIYGQDGWHNSSHCISSAPKPPNFKEKGHQWQVTKTSEVGHVWEKLYCSLSISFHFVRHLDSWKLENNSISVETNDNHQSGQILLFVNPMLTDEIFKEQWRNFFLNEIIWFVSCWFL